MARQVMNPEEYVLVIGDGDPGGAQALLPTVHALGVFGLRTQILVSAGSEADRMFSDTQFTPLHDINTLENKPSVILASTSHDRTLQKETMRAFPETPIVAIEDYYGSMTQWLEDALQDSPDNEVLLPGRICVIDAIAKSVLLNKFPGHKAELENRIVITGNPAFDSLPRSIWQQYSRRRQARRKFELRDKEQLIVCFTNAGQSPAETKLSQALALDLHKLQNMDQLVRIVARKHPRHDLTEDEYYAMFDCSSGPDPTATIDELCAAADIVITAPQSTTSLRAACLNRWVRLAQYGDSTIPVLGAPAVLHEAALPLDSNTFLAEMQRLLYDKKTIANLRRGAQNIASRRHASRECARIVCNAAGQKPLAKSRQNTLLDTHTY